MSAVEGTPGRPIPVPPAEAGPEVPFDPLKLCIFTTVSLLGWIFGPVAVVVFASIALAGYWKAHQAGLTRSRCYLRDVRLVLAYLLVIALVAVGAIAYWIVQRLG